MSMAMCEDISEQLHLEITGKSAIKNSMHKWCHNVISVPLNLTPIMSIYTMAFRTNLLS